MAETSRSPSQPPSWYGKPLSLSVPAGVIIAVVTALVGAAGAGGVGIATREGDLAAVDARIDSKVNAAVEQLRREVAASDAAAEALAVARYDEILRRLDRIERRIDGGSDR